MMHYLLPAIVVLLVLLLAFRFYLGYARPSRKAKKKLEVYIDELNNINQHRPLDELIHIFSEDEEFRPHFEAYQQTLHSTYEINSNGESEFVFAKSTQPAEAFFSPTSLIDLPMKLDYYRHLPGLLTGIGIVGTFIGLIAGLSGFNTSGSPELVQKSLDDLMTGVMLAFIASGSAIAVAMFITFWEKASTRKHNALLAQFNAILDSLFTPELTETYLEKLVSVAEKNLTQSMQLKDAFVDDLKKMLVAVAQDNRKNQQSMVSDLSQAYANASNQMAANVSQSLGEALMGPLEAIAQGVGQVSQDQGTAVNALLSDVLTAFMDKLEKTFGGQMQGVSQMLAQSSESMIQMQQGITTLIGEMRQVGEDSANGMEVQMKKFIEDMQMKQDLAQDKLLSILAKIAEKGEETNAVMGNQLNEMVVSVSDKVTAMMHNFGNNQQELTHAQTQLTTQLQDQTQATLSDMQQLMTDLVGVTQESIVSSQENIRNLNQVSISATENMNMGAGKLEQSIGKIVQVTDGTHQVIERAGVLINDINTITGSLNLASAQVEQLLLDYKSANHTVDNAMKTLESIMASSSGYIGNSTQMLKDMQNLVVSLQSVEATTQSYIGSFNEVLSEAFAQFQAGTFDGLEKTLGKYDGQLEQGTQYLATVIQDLGEVVEDMSQIKQNAKRIN